MKGDNTEEIRQLTALATNRAPEEEVVQKASEIKTRLVASWQEIIKAVNAVDGLVAIFAPNQQWQPGLVFASSINVPTIPPRPIPAKIGVLPIPKVTTAKAVKAEVVVRIANELATKGEIVTSKKVAIRLRAEGDTRPDKAVETSVGNILARRGWKKVHPGEYAPTGEVVVKDKNNGSGEPVLKS